MKLFFLLLSTIILTVACHDISEFEFDHIKTLKIIEITNEPGQTILANSTDKVNINVEIAKEASLGKREVTLTTSLGKFKESDSSTLNIKATTDNDLGERMANATLVAGVEVGVAQIKATIDDEYFDETTVNFDTAYVEKIVLTPSSFQLLSGFSNEIVLSAQLFRSVGSPSIGNRVAFEVRDALDTRNLGLLRNTKNLSDMNGMVSTSIALSDTSYRGEVILRVKAFNENVEITSATNEISVFVTN